MDADQRANKLVDEVELAAKAGELEKAYELRAQFQTIIRGSPLDISTQVLWRMIKLKDDQRAFGLYCEKIDALKRALLR